MSPVPKREAWRVSGTVEALRPFKWRLAGLTIAAAFYALLWLAVVAGARGLVAPLLVVSVIAFLVAGGNWLQQWLGIERPSPKFAERAHDEEDGSAGAAGT